ncbi:helix-turn-helix domain-containing protein [Maribacter arcticus]|jgi:transcriptional regulator with XRE-family HTH domain|uniref:Helix-turn-helix n=1 Tax=Maribacter arcticus TaxID=561365 RepID=A0A1T5C3M5_9FLAO|nr:helix-turn-helix transcriptional regulator [Maribacter arcticus]SKB53730.1 Helix-turn-helix [Maribacter arcticus]|tara:strand:- start:379 stop:669 length:291 start_codon:yes stop_codon:yes gene_type:complete
MNKYSVDKLPRDIRIEIAHKHRKLRKQRGLSQTELAERSGVSLGSLKRFETKGQVSLESLLKLVFVLGRLSDFESILKPDENLKHIEKLFDSKRKS